MLFATLVAGGATVDPFLISLVPSLLPLSSTDYATLISASLHLPLINNIYGSLSDGVCLNNVLIRESENIMNPNPVDETSVPGMKNIDTATSTLKWDQYDDGRRQNRGSLKVVPGQFLAKVSQ